MKQAYSDLEREKELEECNILINPPDPEVHFDLSELRLKEVREVVHKARASSVPASNRFYLQWPPLVN